MVSLQAAIAALALSGVGQTVLLDFYSDSCGPCRAMNPTVQALIDAGYPVERVNVVTNPQLVARFGVTSWPCFIMVVNGREVDREVGRTSMKRLQQMCQKGAPAAAASRSSPMLARNRNSAPPVQPIAPTPIPAPSSMSAGPPVDPWAAPAAVQPIPISLKAPSSVSDAALLAASVRLRVEDPDGRSCGSGTIIDSRSDEALVLTCGHIFRDSQGKGRITVDLFGSGEPQQVAGKLISYDLTRDVGLVSIHTSGPVAMARLAPPDYKIKKGMAVASVGCNQGDPPTVQHSQVNSLNDSQEPPCVWVAGQPVEGRSGGGLFSSEGYVIGVCDAADPSSKEGYFAAPASLYAELDRDQLAFVYKSPGGNQAGTIREVVPSAMSLPPAANGPTDLASLSSPSAAPSSAVVPTSAIEPIANLPAHEQAALDEIRRREKAGAKVIIVVCPPPGTADGKSDVIVLDHASPALLKQLAAENRREDSPFHTSSKRKVILEWTRPPEVPVPNPVATGSR
jgi:thiol-disulfide isomerase/thioredoxin